MERVDAVYSCIVNDQNEILMVYNQDVQEWSLPGGKVEKGETLNQAVLRETFEETGYHVTQKKLIALNECKMLHHDMHAVFFTFSCDIVGGSKRTQFDDEISKVEWKSFEDADELMPYHHKSIKDIIKMGIDYIDQGTNKR